MVKPGLRIRFQSDPGVEFVIHGGADPDPVSPPRSKTPLTKFSFNIHKPSIAKHFINDGLFEADIPGSINLEQNKLPEPVILTIKTIKTICIINLSLLFHSSFHI